MEFQYSDFSALQTYILPFPTDYCRAPPVVHQYRRDQLVDGKDEIFICHTRIIRFLVVETTIIDTLVGSLTNVLLFFLPGWRIEMTFELWIIILSSHRVSS